MAIPVGHRLAQHDEVRASDLAGEAWIGVPVGYPFDDLRIAISAGAALDVRLRLRDN